MWAKKKNTAAGPSKWNLLMVGLASPKWKAGISNWLLKTFKSGTMAFAFIAALAATGAATIAVLNYGMPWVGSYARAGVCSIASCAPIELRIVKDFSAPASAWKQAYVAVGLGEHEGEKAAAAWDASRKAGTMAIGIGEDSADRFAEYSTKWAEERRKEAQGADDARVVAAMMEFVRAMREGKPMAEAEKILRAANLDQKGIGLRDDKVRSVELVGAALEQAERVKVGSAELSSTLSPWRLITGSNAYDARQWAVQGAKESDMFWAGMGVLLIFAFISVLVLLAKTKLLEAVEKDEEELLRDWEVKQLQKTAGKGSVPTRKNRL